VPVAYGARIHGYVSLGRSAAAQTPPAWQSAHAWGVGVGLGDDVGLGVDVGAGVVALGDDVGAVRALRIIERDGPRLFSLESADRRWQCNVGSLLPGPKWYSCR